MNSRVVAEYESVSAALFSISTQAGSIARGLESAAPSAQSASTGSVHYLHAVASQLKLDSTGLLPERWGGGTEQTYHALLVFLQRLIQQDTELREKYQVGGRFRFVKDRLQELQHGVEERAAEQVSAQAVDDTAIAGSADIGQGKPVYIYLYNTQGAVLRTWAAMLTPRAFYEYSVHRPVYREKKSIEDIIALKANPLQHAYMTVMVTPSDIVEGETVIRVKEGALKLERLLLFTHNDQDFVFTGGELVKKI